MNGKQLTKIVTGNYPELKRLPKYQKIELIKASKLLKKVQYYKFGIISFTELKRELRIILT